MAHDQTRGHASIVMVLGPENQVPLVIEDHHDTPYWKFPGGRKERNETPLETAIRELEEETGLRLQSKDLSLLKEVERRSHVLYLFGAVTPVFSHLRERGIEGERVALFQQTEILTMVDFLPFHRQLLTQIGVTR